MRSAVLKLETSSLSVANAAAGVPNATKRHKERNVVPSCARLCGASHHRDGRQHPGATPEPTGFASTLRRCKSPEIRLYGGDITDDVAARI